MEHLKLESITDSPDFWNDSYSISSYCNSILHATKKQNQEVSIFIGEHDIVPRVSYEKRNSLDKYLIFLPKIKDFYLDKDIQKEDIKLRKAFLKHELSHIIYSEMETYLDHHKESPFDIKMLANAIEDVRIEWAFGKRFPGSNDTFFDVQNKFYLKSKKNIENDPPSMFNLSLYFLYRSKKFEFEKTFPIQIYDKIFEKHSDFLNLSRDGISSLLESIKNDFKQQEEELKQQIEDFKEQIPKKEKIKMSQEQYDNLFSDDENNSENQDDPQTEIEIEKEKDSSGKISLSQKEPDSNESDQQQNSEKEEDENNSENEDSEEDSSDSDSEEDFDDSDSEEDSSDSDSEEDSDDSQFGDDFSNSKQDEDSDDSDSEDDNNSISGNGKNNSSNQQSSEEDKLNSNDFSEMIKEQMKNNLNKELKKLEEFNSENSISEDIDETEEIDDPLNPESKIKVLNVFKIIDNVPDDYLSKLSGNSEIFEEFLKYNNSKMKNKAAKIIDISRYLSIYSKRKKTGRKNSKNSRIARRNQDQFNTKRSIYSQLTSKNSKNIIELINFFKLKFQNKEKSKRFFNKEEGDLNNQSLYKLFNHQEDKRIFSNLQKSLVIKEDVSFLLDFSGSMTGSKLKSLMESMVILNEVFTKIEIPFNVFSFTGKDPYFYLKYSNLSEKTVITNAFNSKDWNCEKSNYNSNSKGDESLNISPKNNLLKAVTFCLLNRNSKAEERKKIIELLLNITYGIKQDPNIYNLILSGSTPEIQAMIGLYNTLPKQKLFLINDGEYDNIDFFGKEINSIKNIASSNTKNVDYYKLIYKLICGDKITVKNLEERNLFNKALKQSYYMLSNNSILNGFINKFFTDYIDSQKDELEKAYNIINDLKYLMDYVCYDSKVFNQNDYSAISLKKYFKIEKTYISRKDWSEFRLITNSDVTLPSFNIKVNNKIVSRENKDYYSSIEYKSDIFVDAEYITDYKDIYKMLCFDRPDILFKINDRKDLSTYTYRDLISKMRLNGWSVFGLGIESDYGKNYIGDQNFAYVKNYKDIRENLEKKIKKII